MVFGVEARTLQVELHLGRTCSVTVDAEVSASLSVTWSELIDEVVGLTERTCDTVSGLVDGGINGLIDFVSSNPNDDVDTSTICSGGKEIIEETLKLFEQELTVHARVHGSLGSGDGLDARLTVEVDVPAPGNTSFAFTIGGLLSFPD